MQAKIKDLKTDSNASVRVRVCAQGNVREVNSRHGYKMKVSSFLVGDETGHVEFSAFGKDMYEMGKLVGKVLDMKDIWVKSYRGEVQLSKGRAGTWEVVNDPDFPLTSQIMKTDKLIVPDE